MSYLRPDLGVERIDEVRAFAQHLTYTGLVGWFRTLQRAPVDYFPRRRRTVDQTGQEYDVELRHTQVHGGRPKVTASAWLAPLTGEHLRLKFLGRGYGYNVQVWPKDEADIVDRQFIGPDTDLAWRRTDLYNYRLIVPGRFGNLEDPTIFTAQRARELDVVDAEQLLLSAPISLTRAEVQV